MIKAFRLLYIHSLKHGAQITQPVEKKVRITKNSQAIIFELTTEGVSLEYKWVTANNELIPREKMGMEHRLIYEDILKHGAK